VSDATITSAAKATGVDLSRLPPDVDATIRANLELAQKLGITGTPSWVVGDQLLSGALPLDRLKEAIARARAS
jgi:protein-disulfide isomerase